MTTNNRVPIVILPMQSFLFLPMQSFPIPSNAVFPTPPDAAFPYPHTCSPFPPSTRSLVQGEPPAPIPQEG